MIGNEVWVDAGSDPDPAKFARAGATVPYFDARWVAAKSDPLDYLKAWSKAPGMTGAGLYLCDPWQWPGPPTNPGAWADYAYDLVQRKCAPGTSGSFPHVDLNYEQDNPAWLVAMLQRWRSHEPKRVTSWVVQARKAPIYSAIVPTLNKLGITVKCECYVGNMERVESSAETEAWRAAGATRVFPMLDGAQLGAYWQGSAFTMGRLP